jgi:hypothetical protein
LPPERAVPLVARIPQHSLTKKRGMTNILLAEDETMELEGSFMLRETLATLEKALPGSMFARMNHSLILNICQIEELQVLGAGGNHFQMKDGRIVALTLQLSEMESLLRHVIN